MKSYPQIDIPSTITSLYTGRNAPPTLINAFDRIAELEKTVKHLTESSTLPKDNRMQEIIDEIAIMKIEQKTMLDDIKNLQENVNKRIESVVNMFRNDTKSGKSDFDVEVFKDEMLNKLDEELAQMEERLNNKIYEKTSCKAVVNTKNDISDDIDKDSETLEEESDVLAEIEIDDD